MNTYQVASARVAGHGFGETVTVADLAGCNIEALVAGGHLVPVADKVEDTQDSWETD
jgi:hypothetical protein